MKYIKTYEQLDKNVAYSIGDIVVCIDPDFYEVGSKFKVEKIYTYNDNDMFLGNKIELDHITYSQLSKDCYVNVKNLEDNYTFGCLWSTKFISEFQYNAIKFNI